MAGRRNIYEQEAYNKRLTWLVMFGFILFLAFIGFGFDYFLLGAFEGDSFFPLGTIIAVAIGIGMALWSLETGAKSVIYSTGADPADPDNPAHRQLIDIVEEMSIASGLPKPQVFIDPDPDPNAFATGKDPQHSYIVVTQGLLDTLNREELQGVIAHEMSHVRNYDIRLMTVVAALIGAIVLLAGSARVSGRLGRFSGLGRKTRNAGEAGVILLILWLIAIILAPMIAQLMAMLVSRRREYLADASGAELTRNPLALASALKKLDAASDPTESIKQGAAHMCIVDPLGRSINSKEGLHAELFGTHPPIEKRILALDAMAYEFKTATPAA